MKLTQFKALTFDVIGTLINFEAGILKWLRPRIDAAGKTMTDQEILEAFATWEEHRQVAEPEKPFAPMLPLIWQDMCHALGMIYDDEDAQTFFTKNVAEWPAFPDSVEALSYLREHFHLVAMTNGGRVATDILARTLANTFHKTITVEDMGFTKPHPQTFAYVEAYLNGLGIERPQWLHVAQSQYHDIVPATDLKLNTAWIERRHAEQGYGASPVPPRKAVPDFHFKSLIELAEAHKAELARG
ncbi:HAD family hydrolase [Zavarzinia sp. CC-PAN008]|uniref:HAD family hydrolase n=1 Tax=Zavarzinia sp. CC-PAN008 TaxID=3243332 RepID=UPI003F745760